MNLADIFIAKSKKGMGITDVFSRRFRVTYRCMLSFKRMIVPDYKLAFG